jgi:hypothetical protein
MIPDPSGRNKPNKTVAIVFLLFGVFALGLSAIVLFLPTAFWGIKPVFRIGFGLLILAYGLFRIYSGLDTFRRAAIAEREEAASQRETATLTGSPTNKPLP